MRVLSLFSGLGGLDLGFADEEFDIVAAADAEPAAVQCYNQNMNPVARRLDLAEAEFDELPDADVIIGGPPCQSFSLVGRRRADDPRGQLVFRFVDFVRAKRPKAFVMENVPGLESSKIDGRRLVDILVEQFEVAGYNVVGEKLIATDYLVPQRRRRLFLIGVRGGQPRLPDPGEFATRFRLGSHGAIDLTAAAAIGDLGRPTERGRRAAYRTDREPSPLAVLLRGADATDVSLHESPRMSATDRRLVAVIPPGGNYRDVPDHLATPRIMRFKETGGRTTTYGRLHPDRPAYTINTYFRRPNVGCHFHYADERLITAREAMRFQTLPDRFIATASRQDTRNALIGNAVPPMLARAIAWALRDVLNSHAREARPAAQECGLPAPS